MELRRQSWRSRNLHTRRMRIELVLLVLASCTVEVLIPVLWTCEEQRVSHAESMFGGRRTLETGQKSI